MTALMRDLPDSIDELLIGATGAERLPDLGWNVSGYIAHMIPYDPDLLAESRHYNDVALQGAIWSFGSAVENWFRTVVMLHSERGAMDLSDVVASNVHDAYHHRWDVTRILGAS